MMTVPIPGDAAGRLAAGLRRRRRRTLALLGLFAATTVLMLGLWIWSMAGQFLGVRVAPPANEYVIFFLEDLTVPQQLAELRRYPTVDFVQTGKLPGVVVVRISGDVDAGVRALRQDRAVLQVQKSVVGMVCH